MAAVAMATVVKSTFFFLHFSTQWLEAKNDHVYRKYSKLSKSALFGMDPLKKGYTIISNTTLVAYAYRRKLGKLNSGNRFMRPLIELESVYFMLSFKCFAVNRITSFGTLDPMVKNNVSSLIKTAIDFVVSTHWA